MTRASGSRYEPTSWLGDSVRWKSDGDGSVWVRNILSLWRLVSIWLGDGGTKFPPEVYSESSTASCATGYELVRLNGMPCELLSAFWEPTRNVCPTGVCRKRRRRKSSPVSLSAGRSLSFTTESAKSVCRICNPQGLSVHSTQWCAFKTR